MKVSGIARTTVDSRLGRLAAGVCTACVSIGWMTGAAIAGGGSSTNKGKPDDKPVMIPLEPLGFTSISPRFVSTLATNFSIHFVDENHLLLTYTARTLLARLPDTREDDDDRNVAALLLELPSGKVLARTEWRTRDRGRFLWPLGHGRFLLRVRSRLSVIAPVGNLAAGGPERAFRQEEFLDIKRPIGYVAVSPDKDLLGIETLAPHRPKVKAIDADAAALAAAMAGTSDEAVAGTPANVDIVGERREPPVQIHFYRLKMEHADGTGRMLAQAAGLIGSRALIDLPATGDGYLDLKKESAHAWDLDFVSHTGKRMELAAYETSCSPRPYFVSRGEFVAFGCRGADDRPELSYFNMKGEQPWLSALNGQQVSPIVIAAPAAGRIAVSRTLVGANAVDMESLTSDDLTLQEIVVMQNHDGRQLLKVQATPIQRAGQNFDLSPEGLSFAVVRNGNIEVYPLPALTGADKKALEEVRKMEPERNDAPIKLAGVAASVETESAVRAKAAVAAPGAAIRPAAAPAAAMALPAAEASQSAEEESGATVAGPVKTSEGQLGDAEGASRKRPSLYSTEFPKSDADGSAGAKPQ